MAKVFFAKNGKSENRANQGVYFPILDLVEAYSDVDLVFSAEPPEFNSDEPDAEIARYRHVVISIDADEVCDKFKDEGYYIVPNETPEQAAHKLNIENPELY